jgi:hypothetical protein
MPSVEENISEEILSCVDDLNAAVPGITVRYKKIVILLALAEYFGATVCSFIHEGICPSDQARRILAHVNEVAFADRSGDEAANELFQ